MSVATVHSHASDSEPVVRVAQGALDGAKVGRLSVLRGVPYAKAERFGAPEPVAPWQGVRSAMTPGAVCPQLPSRLEKVMGAPRQPRPMSEACQFLSIFSPDV